MKHYIFLFFLSFFTITGCAFLGGSASDDLNMEEESAELAEGEFAPDDEEGSELEEEEFASEDEAGDELAEEEEQKGGGFFSWLFGSSDEEDIEEERDFVEENEGDYEEYDEEDSMADYEEEGESADDESNESSVAAQKDSAPDQASAQASLDQDQTPSASEKTSSAEIEKPSFIPLKKIRSAPYTKAGHLINAVYIARPNDTLESVSQKIYGEDQSGKLRQINPHLKSRSVTVGDKIYYDSPHRKNDNSRLLFYYQDINAPRSFHELSPGDNLRQTAAQLLGHPKSWKEIWATNPDLKSKGEITNSATIFYWPENVSMAKSSDLQPATPPGNEALEQEQGPEQMPVDSSSAEESLPVDSSPANKEPEPFIDLENEGIKVPSKEGDSAVSALQIILKKKEAVIALLGIIIALILMIRLIVKKRKQKEFDYTATDIKA